MELSVHSGPLSHKIIILIILFSHLTELDDISRQATALTYTKNRGQPGTKTLLSHVPSSTYGPLEVGSYLTMSAPLHPGNFGKHTGCEVCSRRGSTQATPRRSRRRSGTPLPGRERPRGGRTPRSAPGGTPRHPRQSLGLDHRDEAAALHVPVLSVLCWDYASPRRYRLP